MQLYYSLSDNAPGGTRTPSLGVRSALLYPLEPLGQGKEDYSISRRARQEWLKNARTACCFGDKSPRRQSYQWQEPPLSRSARQASEKSTQSTLNSGWRHTEDDCQALLPGYEVSAGRSCKITIAYSFQGCIKKPWGRQVIKMRSPGLGGTSLETIREGKPPSALTAKHRGDVLALL